MKKALLLAIGVLAVAGCSDKSDRDKQKTDTLNSQPADKSPQIDQDPTPETGTGGEQQGTQPSQPAAD
jgi:hypothetical protein